MRIVVRGVGLRRGVGRVAAGLLPGAVRNAPGSPKVLPAIDFGEARGGRHGGRWANGPLKEGKRKRTRVARVHCKKITTSGEQR